MQNTEQNQPKISVKVCLGTTCFIMGASTLQRLNAIIPEKYGNQVSVNSSNCLGLCSIDWGNSKAPYVKVNDEIVKDATVEKVLEVIDKMLMI